MFHVRGSLERQVLSCYADLQSALADAIRTSPAGAAALDGLINECSPFSEQHRHVAWLLYKHSLSLGLELHSSSYRVLWKLLSGEAAPTLLWKFLYSQRLACAIHCLITSHNHVP